MNSLTRIRTGDVVDLDGAEFVAVMVNECRARCLPLRPEVIKTKELFREEVVTEKRGRPANISPNSEVPIVRTMSRRKLNFFLKKWGKR